MHPKASNQNIYRAPEDYEREGAENALRPRRR